MQNKRAYIWIFAVILTISAAIYQRLTGPTHPQRTQISISGQTYKFKLLRTFDGDGDCPITVTMPDTEVAGTLEYRIFPQKVDFTKLAMTRDGANISASLPHQGMAGKLEYKIVFNKGNEQFVLNNGTPTVIRFKGYVPNFILIPHILIMFLAMLFSNVAGIFALFKIPSMKMLKITLGTIFIGGLIMGPLVQKYAFNELWAGVPYGWDLTDNKTLIAFIAWVIAYLFNRKQESRYWVVAAMVVTMGIFSIPHSLFGSQLDAATGKIIQGSITPFISMFF
ncbi:MAG: hypothetical protein WCP08_07545 [Prolixibacteraceae bacterium]